MRYCSAAGGEGRPCPVPRPSPCSVPLQPSHLSEAPHADFSPHALGITHRALRPLFRVPRTSGRACLGVLLRGVPACGGRSESSACRGRAYGAGYQPVTHPRGLGAVLCKKRATFTSVAAVNNCKLCWDLHSLQMLTDVVGPRSQGVGRCELGCGLP